MSASATTTKSTLFALPFEIRQQIYRLLLSNLVITPTTTHPTAVPQGSSEPHLPRDLQADRSHHHHHHHHHHPDLAILHTCRAIHAEALPVFTSTATLSLRQSWQHLLLTQSSHRVPALTEITGVHLGTALLDHYDALTLNTALFALRRLEIGPLSVKVPHDALGRLDAKREVLGGSGNNSGSGGGGGVAISEVQLDLITRLIARLDHELADKVMKLLAAGRRRGWNVKVGFHVECMSEGRLLLAGEEGSRHVCAFGGLEVGYELVGRAV